VKKSNTVLMRRKYRKPPQPEGGVSYLKTDKTEKIGNRTFLINVVGRQHSTWQGTITLLGEKATQVTKLPLSFVGNEVLETLADSAETRSFRSLLELIHLINGTLEEDDE
jgi:hypothetical protein